MFLKKHPFTSLLGEKNCFWNPLERPPCWQMAITDSKGNQKPGINTRYWTLSYTCTKEAIEHTWPIRNTCESICLKCHGALKWGSTVWINLLVRINAQADLGCSLGAHHDQGPPDWSDFTLKEQSIMLKKLLFWLVSPHWPIQLLIIGYGQWVQIHIMSEIVIVAVVRHAMSAPWTGKYSLLLQPVTLSKCQKKWGGRKDSVADLY